MNLRQVETFCAVMRCRTVVAAAHELGISQPAVSNSIKHLEAQLGFPLFEKVSNRLVPTNDALALYRESEPLESMAHALAARLSDIQLLRRGSLRIIATQALGRSIVAPSVSRFTNGGRDIYVYFDIRRMEGVVESIETGFADLGFAVAPAPRPGINIEVVASAEMVVAMPRGHPLASRRVIAPVDIAKERLIGLEASSRIGSRLRKAFDDCETPYRCDVEVRHCVSACMLVERGVGVSVVDEFSARRTAGWDIELRPFVPAITLNACVMHSASRSLSRLAKRFLSEVRNAGKTA